MVKRKRKKSSRSKSKNIFVNILKYLSLGIWYMFKYLSIGIYWIFKGIFRFFLDKFKHTPKKPVIKRTNKNARSNKKNNKNINSSVKSIDSLKIVESLKGNFNLFWKKLNKSDSLIGIILGARGSGKTAVAMNILENLENRDKHYYAMGFPSKELPKWIEIVDKIDKIKNNSYVVIDEGGILFSSRQSMSNANKVLSELLFIARHKNLTIFFISQNSSNLEVNTLRQADFLILKRSSLLQKNFERKIVSDIYKEYQELFNKYKSKKGLFLLYSDDFLGFVENDLPSFWSKKVSKSFK